MEMHRHLKEKGMSNKIKAVTADPGLATSNLQVTSTQDGLMPHWAAKMLARGGHSAPDGALSAAMGSFSPDANSGDMYMPEGQLKGPPVKCIAGGQAVEKGKEKLTTTLPHWKKTKNMDIITVSIDQNPERAKHFIDKYRINLPAYLDHNEFYQKNLKVQSVPYWAVFQKDKVSAKWMMTDDGKGFDEKEILVKMKPGPQKVI